MNNFSNYLNLKAKTELLESLGWDEVKLSQLESYLSDCFSSVNFKHPITILKEVEDHFGEDTSEVLKNIFENELKNIINYNGGIYDEH